MRTIDNGCFFGVIVEKAEVEAFKDTWPCSNLPERFVWFQFDKRNGDLVDFRPGYMDGPDVVALAENAKAHGVKELQLTL